MNENGARFCHKCGLALDERSALERDGREVLGRWVTQKAGEVEVSGSLDDLLLTAAKKGLREMLGDKEVDQLLKDQAEG